MGLWLCAASRATEGHGCCRVVVESRGKGAFRMLGHGTCSAKREVRPGGGSNAEGSLASEF